MPVPLHDFKAGIFIMKNRSQTLRKYLFMQYGDQTRCMTARYIQYIYHAEQTSDHLHDCILSDNYHARQRSDPLHDCGVWTHIFFAMQNRNQTIWMTVLSDNYHARQCSDPLHDCKTHIFTMQNRIQAICMTVYCLIIIMQYRGQTHWMTVFQTHIFTMQNRIQAICMTVLA